MCMRLTSVLLWCLCVVTCVGGRGLLRLRMQHALRSQSFSVLFSLKHTGSVELLRVRRLYSTATVLSR
jgi:hypothetical protein